MALNSSRQYIQLAQSLPPQLTRFFARYPPASILSSSSSSTSISPTTTSQLTSSPPPSTPLPSAILPSSLTNSSELNTISNTPPSSSSTETSASNPFQPQKSPITGRWHDPVYSLRRQADLVKLARQYGVESLLPFTVKKTEERLTRRLEHGLRVKGTGVGEKVRGKIQERTLKARLEKRRQAMLSMPKMIQEWKEKGHGRGWKKWPKP